MTPEKWSKNEILQNDINVKNIEIRNLLNSNSELKNELEQLSKSKQFEGNFYSNENTELKNEIISLKKIISDQNIQINELIVGTVSGETGSFLINVVGNQLTFTINQFNGLPLIPQFTKQKLCCQNK